MTLCIDADVVNDPRSAQVRPFRPDLPVLTPRSDAFAE
jgi:hypothetical protein